MSHRIRRSIPSTAALALAAAALVAPAAQARVIDSPATGPNPPGIVVQQSASPATQVQAPAPGLNHGAGIAPAVPVTPTAPKSGDSGVDWNALAAGAGIGGATVLLLAAGVSARGRRSGRVAV